jgi:hypothetical protein
MLGRSVSAELVCCMCFEAAVIEILQHACLSIAAYDIGLRPLKGCQVGVQLPDPGPGGGILHHGVLFANLG